MLKHNLNLDFSVRLTINAGQLAWIPAPPPRVWRKQFEREHPERGRATSLVRYQAGSGYDTHTHPRGEEILVLEGVFSDEHGDYPAGTYLRNPPGSTHTPYSERGCILFVKLDHFHPEDDRRVVILPDEMPWIRKEEGHSIAVLHQHEDEITALVRWPQGQCQCIHQRWGGEEILILEGRLADEQGEYPNHTWIRSPHLSDHTFTAEDGTLVFFKAGHLPVPG